MLYGPTWVIRPRHYGAGQELKRRYSEQRKKELVRKVLADRALSLDEEFELLQMLGLA